MSSTQTLASRTPSSARNDASGIVNGAPQPEAIAALALGGTFCCSWTAAAAGFACPPASVHDDARAMPATVTRARADLGRMCRHLGVGMEATPVAQRVADEVLAVLLVVGLADHQLQPRLAGGADRLVRDRELTGRIGGRRGIAPGIEVGQRDGGILDDPVDLVGDGAGEEPGRGLDGVVAHLELGEIIRFSPL